MRIIMTVVAVAVVGTIVSALVWAGDKADKQREFVTIILQDKSHLPEALDWMATHVGEPKPGSPYRETTVGITIPSTGLPNDSILYRWMIEDKWRPWGGHDGYWGASYRNPSGNIGCWDPDHPNPSPSTFIALIYDPQASFYDIGVSCVKIRRFPEQPGGKKEYNEYVSAYYTAKRHGFIH